MIKKIEQLQTELVKNLKGGEGSVHIKHLFSEKEMKSNSRFCAQITIPPGASIGLHSHDMEEEIYIITRGSGLLIENGKEFEVKEGHLALTDEGRGHAIKNNSHQNLELYAIINCY